MDDLIADNVGAGNMNGGGSPFFKENGNYQAMHAINMAFKKLNLSTPSELYEAATKEYVSNVKRPHIIAVYANYHGHLRAGEHQFAFAGSVINLNGSTGFLVLQSGRIKKIQAKFSYQGTDMEYLEMVGSVFTINAIKSTERVSNLLTYECPEGPIDPNNPLANYAIRCWFDWENMPISEGDIINIKTKIDYKFEWRVDGKPIFSYLFTFLLELDPL